ncbi:MAG: hypothetical protein ACTSPY_13060 [Candidatus Helarchaeota archaeon]
MCGLIPRSLINLNARSKVILSENCKMYSSAESSTLRSFGMTAIFLILFRSSFRYFIILDLAKYHLIVE